MTNVFNQSIAKQRNGRYSVEDFQKLVRKVSGDGGVMLNARAERLKVRDQEVS